MPLVDPLSWSVLAFGDQTSWLDFLGAHDLWFAELVQRIRQAGSRTITRLPMGDGGPDFQDIDQLAHDSTSDALNVQRGPDLRSYDLNQSDQYASWAFIHAQDCIRLAKAAGV